MYFRIFTFIVLLFSIIACDNNASQQATKPPTPTLASEDAKMINNAYRNLLLSIKMAEEAVNRSTTAETKQLAQNIMNEHSKMLDGISIIAQKHASDIPLDISADQTKEWQDLVRQKGIAFDKYYAQIVHGKHQQRIEIFSHIKQNAANKDLQSIAQQFVAVAEEHKQQAVILQELLNNRRSRDTIAIEPEVSQLQ